MDQKISSEVSKVSEAIVSPLLPSTNLPIELICLVLSKLPIENLERLWVFNNDWFIVIKAFCLDFYRSAFQGSTLWAYLPQDPSVQNIPLLSYFDEFMDESWTTTLRPEKYINLEKFIVSQAMSDEALDKLLVGIDRKILVEEEKYLIQQRQASTEITIIDVLKNPPLNWLKIAKAYRHIETTLNIFLLAHFIFNDRSSFKESILLILDRRLTRCLTGSGLELLVEHTIEPKKLLLSHLINFALDKGPLQKNAQELLYHLTDKDCESLLVRQHHILVDAIKRQCFPIIDSFGPRALRKVIEENPHDDLLVTLLDRLGAGQLSKILPSLNVSVLTLNIEDKFPVIVNHCSQFMTQLLAKLTFEQVYELIKALHEERLICLLNSSVFLEFLEKLDKNQEILNVTKNTAHPDLNKLSITYSSNELLLYLSRAQSYFASAIILTKSSKYLNAIGILILLKDGRAIWDALQKAGRLDDFLGKLILIDFIELYLCFYKAPHVPPSINENIYKECERRLVVVKKTAEFTPYTVNVTYWKLFTDCDLKTLTYEDLEQAKLGCVENIHTAFLNKINPLLAQKKKEKQAQKLLEKSGNLNADEEAADSLPPVKTQQTPVRPNKAGKEQSNDLTPLLSDKVPVAIIDTNVPQKTQQDSQQTISQRIDSAPSQNNVLMSVIWSITKGFFVGVLVMGTAVLLLMFINYQMNVPLIEIINELWIAGVAGIFADLVATACFLMDAKIFEPSTFPSVNEKADDSKPFNILNQFTPTANPEYGNETFFPATKTVDTSKAQAHQIYPPAPVVS